MSGRRALTAVAAATVVTVCAALLATLIIVFGGDDAAISYRSLDYDVTMQPDGDLRITQHIDVRLGEREDDDGDAVPWKQLYQQYTLDPDNLTAISDVSVTDATTGTAYDLNLPVMPDTVDDAEWNRTYAGRWSIADVTDNASSPQPYTPGTVVDSKRVVEIAWNIPATTQADSMRFDIAMTFEGVTTAYADVAAFQWEPFGPTNQMPIGTVTGTVHLPDGGDNGLTRAWLHFDGTSETARSNATLQFTAYDVRAGQHLDLVVMVDVQATDGVARQSEEDAATRIIDDESRQERAWRESQRRSAVIRVIVWIALAVLGAAAIAWGIVASIRSNRQADDCGDAVYWRDPPALSPASAAKLLAVVDPSTAGGLNVRQMSATVLSLASKHAITVRPGPAELYEGGDADDAAAAATARGRFSLFADRGGTLDSTATITINPVCANDPQSLNLCASEHEALQLLQAGAERRGAATFDLKQLNDAFADDEQGYTLQQAFDQSCANEFALLGATKPIGGQAMAAGMLAAVTALIALIANGAAGQLAMALALGCPLIFGAVFVLCSLRRTGLTDEGRRLAAQVVGLKRYLEDFSDFSDRGVADLTLWDRYLVYAAAYGISDTVLKQLSETHPELSDPQWLDSYATGHLIYWSYRPYWYARAHGMGTDGVAAPVDMASFSANVGNIGACLNAGFADVSQTFQAAAPHASGVSGGSFSGGGFGGFSGGSGGGSFGGR